MKYLFQKRECKRASQNYSEEDLSIAHFFMVDSASIPSLGYKFGTAQNHSPQKLWALQHKDSYVLSSRHFPDQVQMTQAYKESGPSACFYHLASFPGKFVENQIIYVQFNKWLDTGKLLGHFYFIFVKPNIFWYKYSWEGVSFLKGKP